MYFKAMGEYLLADKRYLLVHQLKLYTGYSLWLKFIQSLPYQVYFFVFFTCERTDNLILDWYGLLLTQIFIEIQPVSRMTFTYKRSATYGSIVSIALIPARGP